MSAARTTTETLPTTADPTTFYPERFRGQTVLVTGAAGGLGSVTADRLEREGATVVRTDVASGEHSGHSITALDVTDRASWNRTLDSIMSTHGRVDAALFAHGIQGPESPLTAMSFESWARTLSVNLDGCFHGLAAILPLMTSHGYGRVTILSSISAREGNPLQGAYSASKAGVVSLVKTAAKEVATRNVTVNAVAPSMMDTPMLADLSPERNAALLARVPMGRVGSTAEFSALATWLLSTEASYVTGQTLDLSGGRNTA